MTIESLRSMFFLRVPQNVKYIGHINGHTVKSKGDAVKRKERYGPKVKGVDPASGEKSVGDLIFSGSIPMAELFRSSERSTEGNLNDSK